MDKKQGDGKRWDWLPAHMPGVARLIAEKRVQLGAAHVNECWTRGVLRGEADWFFAREGVLAVGTPFTDPVMQQVANWSVTSTQAMLMIKETKEGA